MKAKKKTKYFLYLGFLVLHFLFLVILFHNILSFLFCLILNCHFQESLFYVCIFLNGLYSIKTNISCINIHIIKIIALYVTILYKLWQNIERSFKLCNLIITSYQIFFLSQNTKLLSNISGLRKLILIEIATSCSPYRESDVALIEYISPNPP